MKDVEIIDAEIVVSAPEARGSVDRAKAGALTFWHEVQWQIENRAWEALGYETLDQFWDSEYMSLNVGIARSDRPELVLSFRRAGQTQQQIAQKLNVSVGTVNGDLKFNSENDCATVTNSRGQERPATYRKPTTALQDAGVVDMATGEVYDPATVTPENREVVQAERARMMDLYSTAQALTSALNRLDSLSDPRHVETYLEIARISKTRPDFPTKHHNPESIRNIAQHLIDYANTLGEQS